MKKRTIFGVVGLLVLPVLGLTVFWALPRSADPAPVQSRSAVFSAPTIVDETKALAAANSQPTNPDALLTLGHVQLKNRQFRDAESSYMKALALSPDKSEVWSALGEARMQFQSANGARMPAGAAEAFTRALALDPRDQRARFYQTMERDFLGQHDAAIGEWLDLLREVPAGSQADEAIRAAITASVKRNQKLIATAVQQASSAQPRATKQ